MRPFESKAGAGRLGNGLQLCHLSILARRSASERYGRGGRLAAEGGLSDSPEKLMEGYRSFDTCSFLALRSDELGSGGVSGENRGPDATESTGLVGGTFKKDCKSFLLDGEIWERTVVVFSGCRGWLGSRSCTSWNGPGTMELQWAPT